VMTGLVAASVPLYSLFCKVTGAGGTPRVADGPATASTTSQTMTIRFDSAVMKDMPWRFQPVRANMTVRLGETNLAIFTAENLAKEGITVHAIAPALVETEMITSNPKARADIIPVGRFGTVEEVAQVAVMLAKNDYMTGQTINVNGGWFMS